MSKIDLQKYFDDTLSFTFQEQEFKVDGSNKAYQLCQKEIRELIEQKTLDDKKTTEAIFKNAFGDKFEEFQKLDLPAKAYNDIAMEIMAEWSGVSKKTIEEQMKIPS